MKAPLERVVQVACAILFVAMLPVATAGASPGEDASDETSSLELFFEHGRYEAEFTSGVLFSLGQPFNFNLDLGVGVRYFVGRNWALNLEYRYQHISNANLGAKNLGINAAGPILGISCFF
jgi:hypothetical protein